MDYTYLTNELNRLEEKLNSHSYTTHKTWENTAPDLIHILREIVSEMQQIREELNKKL